MIIVPKIGDQVHVSKFVWDTWYYATGKVVEAQWDTIHRALLIKVANDWWLMAEPGTCTPVQPDDARCRYCMEAGVDMIPVDVTVNIGEDGEEDDAGCFVEHHVEWKCEDVAACKSRQTEWRELAYQLDKAADATMRESGFGAIGHG